MTEPTKTLRDEDANAETWVHLYHCDQGDYEGSCKYGEDDCPALLLQVRKERSDG